MLNILCLITCCLSAGDFRSEVNTAGQKWSAIAAQCESKLTAGDLDGANALLLRTYPEATRTGAECFVMANVAYEVDRKLSYGLQKKAFAAYPNEPDVAFEWALELHRNGEYAAALARYEQCSKAHPDDAINYGLAADCLLRLGRTDEAIASWKKSERAPTGSLERFENMVCAVHREPIPYARRAELLNKVMTAKDVNAAMDLIALDCDFPRDWWNGGPNVKYLDNDWPIIKSSLGLDPKDPRMRAMECARLCAIVQDAKATASALKRLGFLLDANGTLPPHGGLLPVMLLATIDRDLLTEDELSAKLGPKILAAARAGKDTSFWNAAGYSAPAKDVPALVALEKEAWHATNDQRFAAAALTFKRAQGPVPVSDADLQAALKQFPMNGIVQWIACDAAKSEGKLTKQMLADAAKAEFTRFTSTAPTAIHVNRPRSDRLRRIFAELAAMK